MHTPESIKWEVVGSARPCLDKIRAQMTPAEYEADKRSLQAFLCSYFNTGDCQSKLGASISPMKAPRTPAGGKCLKVRWGVPGGGKSGGSDLPSSRIARTDESKSLERGCASRTHPMQNLRKPPRRSDRPTCAARAASRECGAEPEHRGRHDKTG